MSNLWCPFSLSLSYTYAGCLPISIILMNKNKKNFATKIDVEMCVEVVGCSNYFCERSEDVVELHFCHTIFSFFLSAEFLTDPESRIVPVFGLK